MKMKNHDTHVQIPEELFSRLYNYHVLGRQDEKQKAAIVHGLEKKMNAIMLRRAFSEAKAKERKERQQ